MRRNLTLILFACLTLAWTSPTQAQRNVALASTTHAAPTDRRVALVIGNGDYKIGPLKNPAHDARDMAATLKSLGFEVILRENASLRQMNEAINQFWQSLQKGGVGLFFFAGHGMQVSGVNYLVPVDAQVALEDDVQYECVNAGRVLGRMENAGNGLNIVILDACRNNPFVRSFRSAEQGLAKMDAPAGSLVAFATAPGDVAADGAGQNGLYTSHLLKHLRTPGQKIEDVLKQVRIGVARDSAKVGKRQTPWESSSLMGDFYFAGGTRTASLDVPSTPAAPVAKPLDLKAEKQRLTDEAAQLKRERDELAQLQTEKARLAEERKQLEQAKQLALAPAPKQPPTAPLKPSEPSVGDTWRDPVTGMEFVWVPGGTFKMGCGSWTSNCKSDEKPVHTVQLSGVWLGKFEVTQGQWQKVMSNNPSIFKNGDNFPVEMVSWDDAKAFISKLNAQGSAKFRLPTEAEWESAARSAGKQERYAGGSDIDRVAWYFNNSGYSTHPVGTKASNGLGLYDMSGNVSEWVEDIKAAYSYSSQDNPVVAGGGSTRVRRGGSWNNEPIFARAAYRFDFAPIDRSDNLGFRLARTN